MAINQKALDSILFISAVLISLMLGWNGRLLYAQHQALDRNALFYEEAMSDAQGSYDPNTGYLLFKTDRYNSQFIREGILHEYAHVIYLRDMTDEQIEQYELIYNKTNDYMTSYARTSASEDFAETYARSIICTINYSAIPVDRVDFFKQNVNGIGNKVIS